MIARPRRACHGSWRAEISNLTTVSLVQMQVLLLRDREGRLRKSDGVIYL
jgi:hypothetical protein